MGEQYIRLLEHRPPDIRRVAVARREQHMPGFRLWPDEFDDVPRRYTAPVIVVTAPLRHAVNVRNEILLRLRHEFVERPDHRIFHQPADFEPPVLWPYMWLNAEIEHRPVLHFLLSRRQAVDVSHIGAAGQQTPLLRPVLFAADQLVPDLAQQSGVFIFVRHRISLWPASAGPCRGPSSEPF